MQMGSGYYAAAHWFPDLLLSNTGSESLTFSPEDLKGLQMHAHLGVILKLARGFKRKTKFEEWSWCFWLLTFLPRLNRTPVAKMWYLPCRQLLYVSLHEPWHLSSKRFLEPSVLWLLKSLIFPPPCLKTCIPPILMPEVQITSALMQVRVPFVSKCCKIRFPSRAGGWLRENASFASKIHLRHAK